MKITVAFHRTFSWAILVEEYSSPEHNTVANDDSITSKEKSSLIIEHHQLQTFNSLLLFIVDSKNWEDKHLSAH